MDKLAAETIRRIESESVRVATYEWDAAADRITWAGTVAGIFGAAAAPENEATFLDLAHPDDRPGMEAAISAALEGVDTYEYTYRIQQPTGAHTVVHDIGLVRRDPAGRALGVAGTLIDVTRHRPDFAGIARPFDQAGVAQYEFDVASGTARWSEAACALFDVPFSARIDPRQVVFSRIRPQDLPRIEARFAKILRTMGPFELEYPLRLEDGTERWILDRGQTIGPPDVQTGLMRSVRGVMTDITASRQREAEAQEMADGLRALVERSLAGMYVLDDTLHFTELNDAARKVMGSPDVGVGSDFVAVIRAQWPPDTAAGIIARFRHTLVTGESYTAPPLVDERADLGRIEAYDWRIDRIERPDGRFGVVCHFYDLTVRERQAEELRLLAARLDLAYRAGGMGAWEVDLRSGAVFWSPQVYALFGVAPGTTITTDMVAGLIHPDESGADARTFFESVRTTDMYDSEMRILRPDGASRDIALRGRVAERDADGPQRVIGVAYDITEQRRMERDLRANAHDLRTILDRSIAFIGLLDPDGTLREANQPALAAGGLTREQAIGRPLWDTAWFGQDAARVERLKAALAQVRAGDNVRYDEVVRMRDDTRMTIDFMLAPVMDGGRTVRIVASGFDISDREAALAHANVLMNEINHRSQNLLTLVDVIARQSHAGDPDDFLPRFSARIHALARAQDLLVDSDRDGLWLEELVHSQLAHFDQDVSSQVTLDGPPVFLDAQPAQSLGMALHELATNAGKYGALSVPEGRITLSWRVGPAGDLTLDWAESGGPPCAAPSRNGFGSLVTGKLLERSLKAEVATAYRPQGLHWRAVLDTGFSQPQRA